MAASAFTVFKTAKQYIGAGTIDLDTDSFKIALFTSATTLSAGIASTYTQLNGAATQVTATTNSYPAGGDDLVSPTWGQGTSAGQRKFDATNHVFTASVSAIANIRYAVIYETGDDKLLCYCALSTAQFTLAVGNTLTISFNESGIFTLT